MKIVVLVKEVPDTYVDRKLDLTTGLADREASAAVLDEICERALEVALSYADSHEGTEVVLLSMSPETASTNLRKGLAMGATRLIHIADPRLVGADLSLTAEVLAAAIRRESVDLVIAGNLSTDGSGAVIPGMLAELLGFPQVGSLARVEISDGEVTGTRISDTASLEVRAELPAVISVTESLPDARFANLKGVMAAKKKPVKMLTAAELGIDPDDQSVPRSIMISIGQRPERAAGTKIVDEGDAGTQLAKYLVQNQLA